MSITGMQQRRHTETREMDGHKESALLAIFGSDACYFEGKRISHDQAARAIDKGYTYDYSTNWDVELNRVFAETEIISQYQ